MALNLSELLKKAKEKGMEIASPSPTTQLTRPWQEESILFRTNNQGNIEETNKRSSRKQIHIANNNTNPINVINSKDTKNQGTLSEQNKILNPGRSSIQEIKAREQLGNNQRTTRDQTRDQQDNNEGANQEPVGNKREIIKGTTRDQTENDQGINIGNKRENKSIQDMTHTFNNLTGLQKRFFDYVLEICISREESNTGPISTNEIANYLNCSYESTKIILKRVIAKALIIRLKGKGCRGGFIILEIPKDIKEIALNKKRPAFIIGDPGNNRGNEQGNKLDNLYNSSSSNNINTTTEFNTDINIESLKDIGFTTAHLKQLLEQHKISATILQNSIDAFYFDLKYNNKSKSIKGTPLNFFMGILKNGNPYLPPGNFESPQDRAMRLYSERMKEIQNQREQREKELKEIEFKSWDASLTEDEKENLLPPELKNNKMQSPRLAFRRQFHQDNIWPKIWELIKKST